MLLDRRTICSFAPCRAVIFLAGGGCPSTSTGISRFPSWAVKEAVPSASIPSRGEGLIPMLESEHSISVMIFREGVQPFVANFSSLSRRATLFMATSNYQGGYFPLGTKETLFFLLSPSLTMSAAGFSTVVSWTCSTTLWLQFFCPAHPDI